MKIKAAVIRQMGLPQPYADSKPMSIEEVELDKPGQREVLVQIKAASLCHSDLSTVNGDRPRQMPMVLGHEASGVVQEIGGGISDLKVGDHVALDHRPQPRVNETGHRRSWRRLPPACPAAPTGRPARCPGAPRVPRPNTTPPHAIPPRHRAAATGPRSSPALPRLSAIHCSSTVAAMW